MRCIALSAIAGGLLLAGTATADVSYDLGFIGPINSAANGGITSNSFEITISEDAGLLGIVGFAIMLAGGVFLVLGARTAPAGTEAPPKQKKSKGTDTGSGSLGGKMEDRWRRRWEDRD